MLDPSGCSNPQSEGQDESQPHCSNLTKSLESPGQGSVSGSWVSTASMTGKALDLLCRAPAKGHSAAITTGQENKQLPSSPSTPLGTFYATSIPWNICTATYFYKPNIFKRAGGGDSTEEVCVESFGKEKIGLLFKKNHS